MMIPDHMNASFTHAGISPAREAARSGRAWRSFVVGSAIVVAHAVVALLLLQNTSDLRANREFVQPMVMEIIEPQPSSFLALNGELEPAEPAIVLKMPAVATEFESTEASLLPPKIDPDMRLDVASYSARALLPPGVVATVILALEIGPDGSVMSAKVVRSNAEDAANQAALAYALATQWMPGRIDGEPRAMQASLTVILGEQNS